MNKKTIAIIAVGIVAVLIMSAGVFLLNIEQLKANVKFDMVDYDGMYIWHRQDFKPDKEFITGILLLVRRQCDWVPHVEVYLVDQGQVNSWLWIQEDAEGQYIKKATITIPVKNFNFPVILPVNLEVDTSKTYSIIITAKENVCDDLFVLGDVNNPYPGGLKYLMCPSGQWMVCATDDLYFVVETKISNNPPVAYFTPNSGTFQKGTIDFDGTDSFDPDGDSLDYAWDFNNDGTTDKTTSVTSWTYDIPGDKQISLTVTDPDGASNTMTGAITIQDSSPDTYTLTAHVVSGGNPLPEVQCTLTGSGQTKTGTTDSSGNCAFQVPNGQYTIQCTKLGYTTATKSVVISSASKYTEITMTPSSSSEGYTVSFTVVDASGTGLISDAKVKLVGTTDSFEGTTNASGMVFFYNVEAGTYELTVTKGGITVGKTVTVSGDLADIITLSGGMDLSIFSNIYFIIGIFILAIGAIVAILVKQMPWRILPLIVGIALFVVFLSIAMGWLALGF